MIESKSHTMVMGSGEKGAAWAAQKRNLDQVACLDLRRPRVANAPLVLGDVFKLPIMTGSIDQIYADFIVNGLVNREIAAHQILENPDLLDTNYFPELVRLWFVESLKRSHDSVRRRVKEVGTILKTVALREMWRVLANDGRLQILDFQYNIDWIAHYAPEIVNDNPMFVRLKTLPITREDLNRSASLGKVIRGSTYVQKIELVKKHPAEEANLSGV
ncbi:MAG: hypothetical protein Q7S60_02680 [bacterium]|nr:hypothetical protein [bacterium]